MSQDTSHAGADAANRDVRLTRAKKLLHLYLQSAVDFIFSDEKIFTVAPPVNLQNDTLMVSVAVSKLPLKFGFTELIFVQPGAKVNGAYYRDELLAKHTCLHSVLHVYVFVVFST